MSEWVKRKTRSMVECDDCKTLICWGKMNGAKYDEYWQKGNGKRLCPECFEQMLIRNGICPECHSPRLLHESGCVTCPECGWLACG